MACSAQCFVLLCVCCLSSVICEHCVVSVRFFVRIGACGGALLGVRRFCGAVSPTPPHKRKKKQYLKKQQHEKRNEKPVWKISVFTDVYHAAVFIPFCFLLFFREGSSFHFFIFSCIMFW